MFYILFSRLLKEACTVYMWGPLSPQKHAGFREVDDRGPGRGAAGARGLQQCSACASVFCGTKRFALFSTRITLCYLRTCVCSWLATPTGSLWHLGAKLAERWHIRELGLCVLLGARGVRAHLLLYAVALRLEPEVAVGDLVRDRV